MIVIPAAETQFVRGFVVAFGDEGEATHLYAAVALRKILHLGDVMLPAGKARRAGIMRHQTANTLVPVPDVRVFEHLLTHFAVGREAFYQTVRITSVQCPAVGRDQVLQAKAVFDRYVHS